MTVPIVADGGDPRRVGLQGRRPWGPRRAASGVTRRRARCIGRESRAMQRPGARRKGARDRNHRVVSDRRRNRRPRSRLRTEGCLADSFLDQGSAVGPRHEAGGLSLLIGMIVPGRLPIARARSGTRSPRRTPPGNGDGGPRFRQAALGEFTSRLLIQATGAPAGHAVHPRLSLSLAVAHVAEDPFVARGDCGQPVDQDGDRRGPRVRAGDVPSNRGIGVQ
jgi:hypothetical protein